MNLRIKIINSEMKEKINETRKPIGRFILKENNIWVGIDNIYGHAWIESHKSRAMIIKWLLCRIDTNDLYKNTINKNY